MVEQVEKRVTAYREESGAGIQVERVDAGAKR